MFTTHRLHRSTTVDGVSLEEARGRVVDFRHTSGIMTDMRRTGTDVYEITLVLGGGDDSERVTFHDVRAGERLRLHT